MKFAHEFKAALVKEGFPSHWVNSAIPYGQLKKCIRKVEAELRSIGLDSATLAHLIPESGGASEVVSKEDGFAFQYGFHADDVFRPKLTLYVRIKDGFAIDATLSPGTRDYLTRLALKQNVNQKTAHKRTQEQAAMGVAVVPPSESEQKYSSQHLLASPAFQEVEVPLTFDAEFFEVLQSDVMNLDAIQENEQNLLIAEINALSTELTTITKPSKYSTTDMNRWRELFEIYLDASPFFSVRESDPGKRTSHKAAQQLQWFQSEVSKRGIPHTFKLPTSHKSLERFVAINITLLQNLRFQEINQKAVSKILKKFDKRTKLGAARIFPQIIQAESIMSETMAKAVCAQMSNYIIKLVPQVEDYLCPICFTISWRPIRMKCNHVFCIRCTILMQREKKKFCPLCRDNVIMSADADNIDKELIKFLKRHFPKETREKQIAIETADGIEQFGLSYKHPSEYKCAVM